MCFILIKDFSSKMMKKNNKSKHFVCFVFSSSKTLKVKLQHNTKNFEKIAEINNEIVKKNTTAQLITSKIVWKKPTYAASWSVRFARLLSVWSWPEFMFEVWDVKNSNFLVENRFDRKQNRLITKVWL